jgi:pyruvate kinase
MAKVLRYTESQINYTKDHDYFTTDLGAEEYKKQVVKNAICTAESIGAKNLVVFTRDGFMAKIAAAFRPNMHTYAFSFNDTLRKKLTILFGLKTFQIEEKSVEENLEAAIKQLKEKNLVVEGDKIVTVFGLEGKDQKVPSIQVVEVK